jgi:CHAD domain-containing protein
LTSQVQKLRRLLPKALKAKDVKAVHRARVATRRLRAAMQLTEPMLSDKPLREFTRALRRLRRTLGPLRDVDVMLVHLEELRGDAQHAGAVEWLSGQLRRRRGKLERKCCKKMSSRKHLTGLRAWETLQPELRKGEPTIHRRAAREVPEQLASFRECADEISSFRREPSAAGLGSDVHELRIAGKLLRYTLELATPLGYQLSPTVLRSFKQLQDALGLWHDYVVLGEQALREAMDELLSLHQPQLHGRMLELAHVLWMRSERELDRFTRAWARHGDGLAKEILRTFQPRASQDHGDADAKSNGDPQAAKSDQNGATTTTTTRSSS